MAKHHPMRGGQYRVIHPRKGAFEAVSVGSRGDWTEVKIIACPNPTMATGEPCTVGQVISVRTDLCEWIPAEPA